MVTTMRMSHMQLWRDLIGRLDAAGELPLRGLVEMVQTWLRGHSSDFGNAWEQYGLDQLVRLNPDEFPIDAADMSASEEVSRLRQVEPASLNNLAMFMRDLLWQSMVWQTSQQCPNCDMDALRVLKCSSDGRPVLQCDACGVAWERDLHPWAGDGRLIPMTTTELLRESFPLKADQQQAQETQGTDRTS